MNKTPDTSAGCVFDGEWAKSDESAVILLQCKADLYLMMNHHLIARTINGNFFKGEFHILHSWKDFIIPVNN